MLLLIKVISPSHFKATVVTDNQENKMALSENILIVLRIIWPISARERLFAAALVTPPPLFTQMLPFQAMERLPNGRQI
jgi:hypothetical protein